MNNNQRTIYSWQQGQIIKTVLLHQLVMSFYTKSAGERAFDNQPQALFYWLNKMQGRRLRIFHRQKSIWHRFLFLESNNHNRIEPPAGIFLHWAVQMSTHTQDNHRLKWRPHFMILFKNQIKTPMSSALPWQYKITPSGFQLLYKLMPVQYQCTR